jgi:hypothetical protein
MRIQVDSARLVGRIKSNCGVACSTLARSMHRSSSRHRCDFEVKPGFRAYPPASISALRCRRAGRIIYGQLRQPRTELPESGAELWILPIASRETTEFVGALPSFTTSTLPTDRTPTAGFAAAVETRWLERDAIGWRVMGDAGVAAITTRRDCPLAGRAGTMGEVARRGGKREWKEERIQHWAELLNCRRIRPSTGLERRNGR